MDEIVAGGGHRLAAPPGFTGGFEVVHGRPTNAPPSVTLAPTLLAACGAAALAPEAEDPEGRDLSFTWSSDCADAVFSPSPDDRDVSVGFDFACGRSCAVTLTVDDGECGIVEVTSDVLVGDLEAPSMDADPDAVELWPPSGRRFTIRPSELEPVVADDCDPAPTWSIDGCEVSERGVVIDPAGECGVNPDGSAWVRARRAGQARDGRVYTLLGRASDACGNSSDLLPIATVVVPHDQRALRGGGRGRRWR